jgi:NADH dehydrogenase FAD-containing subunit
MNFLLLSQLQVLRLLSASYSFDSITLIDANPESVYCGSISEIIANLDVSKYPIPDWKIDLKHLCRVHNQCDNIRFVPGKVTDIDLANRSIQLDDGIDKESIPYDLVSIDIGSKAKSINEVPGAYQNVIPTRPVKVLMDRLEEIEIDFSDVQKLLPISTPDSLELEQPLLNLAVVGGGASGIELALSIVGRWKPMLRGRPMNVRLVTSEKILLPEIPYARKLLKDALADRGIYMMFHSAVDRVDEGCLHLESGMTIPFSYCFWATGAAPHYLTSHVLPKRGLAVTSDGWIQVHATLQSLSHPNVFAAGDCSTLVNPLPKAGIFALQEGPVLAENLERLAREQPLVEFQPNMEDLQFLNCGDGTAMGFAFGLVLRGEWVYQIKQAMDQRHFLSLTGEPLNSKHSRKLSRNALSPYQCNTEALNCIKKLPVRQAAQMLTQIDINNYQEAWAILEFMSLNKDFRLTIMKEYNRLTAAELRRPEKRQSKGNENVTLPHFLRWLLPYK